MFFMGVLKHVLLVCVLKHVLKHDNLGLDANEIPLIVAISVVISDGF